MNKLIKKALKILLPLFLGGFVLFWVYRDFDFSRAGEVLLYGTHWGWMLFSLFFGVLSHIIRGWRWKQVLTPLDVHPPISDCVNAVFVSYMANLVFPRIGDITRCGILKKHDNISFAQSFGTVVTERIVDTVCIGLITGFTFLIQMPVCMAFFRETGTKLSSFENLFSSVWFYIILLCSIGFFYLLYRMLRMLSFFDRIKAVVLDMWQGVLSLRKVKNIPLFIFYTSSMWFCYFLHFYLTFFCFEFTDGLSVLAALLMFVGGTFAVVVPTPNGAGPWHFAVITMMMLYGVSPLDAGIFALIVHGIQTFLVVLLGIYGWLALALTSRKKSKNLTNSKP